MLRKLAAILSLGKKCLKGAKKASGNPCTAKDFFECTFRQAGLSSCNRITNLFYLAKNWAIRAHFITMTKQCVANLVSVESCVWNKHTHATAEENGKDVMG